ncbi:MAG: WD40/YVTN/BNR-like repeat-containing protein, partial [Bacteroidota bacterium]
MNKIAYIIQLIPLPVFLLFMTGCGTSKTGEPSREKYTWKNVQIVGGGFVDGVVFHPNEENLVYARTDMGGAYRREGRDANWVPLMDWVSFDDRNLMGVESIALDPNNPDKLYMACGTYTRESSPTGEILRSKDRGETFKRTPVPFKMGGNENGRGNGERMTVDPNNSDILYLGTRHDGLWKSTDGAVTWTKVASFPDVSETMPDTITDQRLQRYWRFALSGSGVVVTLCDPASGVPGQASSTVYALVSLMDRENFFRSMDGGETWEAVPGHPQQYRPNHAVLAKNGMMYISYGDNPGP